MKLLFHFLRTTGVYVIRTRSKGLLVIILCIRCMYDSTQCRVYYLDDIEEHQILHYQLVLYVFRAQSAQLGAYRGGHVNSSVCPKIVFTN
jgi:hypothetical protein